MAILIYSGVIYVELENEGLKLSFFLSDCIKWGLIYKPE